MPPYRANVGGAFGSGMTPRAGGGNLDVSSLVNAIGNQASSLIQSAYLRKMAERERAQQEAALQMAREDKRLARETDALRRQEDVAFRNQELEFRKSQAERQAELERQKMASALPKIVDGNAVRADPNAPGGVVVTAVPGLGAAAKPTPTYEERREGGGVGIYEGGRFVRWKIPPVETAPTRPQLPTEGERKAAALYRTGKQGYETLETLLSTGRGVPTIGSQVMARLGRDAGNLMTSDEYRQMRQAALMLSDAWLRYTSGAAVPETEVERFAQSFIPRAGDDAATLAQKKDSRAVLLNALKEGAGRGLAPASVGTRPTAEEQAQRGVTRPPFDPNDPDD